MQKNNDEIYKALKGMTLEEFAFLFNHSPFNNAEIVEEKRIIRKEDNVILYTINELIEKYPFFTRYNINKAIQNDGLPYCFIGNKRMFNKDEIDKWLERETSLKKRKIKYDI